MRRASKAAMPVNGHDCGMAEKGQQSCTVGTNKDSAVHIRSIFGRQGVIVHGAVGDRR